MSNHTTEDFKKQVRELYPNIETLSEWVDAHTKIKCHCIIDDYEWEVYPRTIIEKGCPKCSCSITRKLTDKEYKEKLRETHDGNIESLEPYVNMNTKILHRCKKHNYEYYTKPSHVVGRNQDCKFCAYEKIANAEKDSIEDVKRKMCNSCGNEFELLEQKYKNNSTKMLFRHNLKDGTHHVFYSTANAIIQGQGCGVCHGQQISIGYNDIATTNPYVASLFENQEETHLYTEWSGKSVNFKCPSCGHVRKKLSVKLAEITTYAALFAEMGIHIQINLYIIA